MRESTIQTNLATIMVGGLTKEGTGIRMSVRLAANA